MTGTSPAMTEPSLSQSQSLLRSTDLSAHAISRG
jgi:hypothetical protein